MKWCLGKHPRVYCFVGIRRASCYLNPNAYPTCYGNATIYGVRYVPGMEYVPLCCMSPRCVPEGETILLGVQSEATLALI